jgi:cyclic nucleotide gated channel alpha 3
MKDGELCTDKKQIRTAYFKTIEFKVDMLCILPLDLFYYSLPNAYKRFYPALRFNKLFKYHRYSEYIELKETETSYPNLLRTIKLMANIILLIHWNGCVYFLVSYLIGFGSDQWVYPAFIDNKTLANMSSADLKNTLVPNDLSTQYIYCLWWSTNVLTTIAEINAATVYYEEIYTTVLLLFGVVVITTVIGSTNNIFNNANARKRLVQKKCDTVKLFLQKHKIDRDFEDRINVYLDYICTHPNLDDEQDATLDFLPAELNRAIAIDINMNTLKRVVIFQDCEPGVLRDLVTKLKLKLFSPNDYVCRKGEIGREMYFIKTGKLMVVSEDGKKIFATLIPGAYFGEISILDIPGNKNGNKRTANIRSVGFTELFQLTKDDLWSVLSEYPIAKQTLLEKGKSLLQKDNLLDQELVDKYERKQQTVYAQLEKLEVCYEKLRNRYETSFTVYTEFLNEKRKQITFLENLNKS